MLRRHFMPEKCSDCACCDEENMKCFPKSDDCQEEYNLTKEDLVVPKFCDFFIPKEGNS